MKLVRQRKTDIILLICGILKNGTNEPIYKTVTDVEKKLKSTRGEEEKEQIESVELTYTHYYI